MNLPHLILASGSRIRQKILQDAGISFEVHKPTDLAEPAPEPDEGARDYVKRAAIAKGMDVSLRLQDQLVLASDQVVEFNHRILRKVDDIQQAKERLLQLSNRDHQLVSYWVLIKDNKIVEGDHSITRMSMHDLSEEECQSYLEDEEPLSSVACYFLEGKGIQLIKDIEGSLFSAMGLPLQPLISALRRMA